MSDDMYEKVMDEWNEKVVGSGGPLDPEQDNSDVPGDLREIDYFDICDMDGSIIECYKKVATEHDTTVPEAIKCCFENTKDGLMPHLHRDEGVMGYLAEETRLDNDEIANCLNVTPTTVSKWFDKHDLENHCLEKWGDEVSWTRQSRKIREIDGNECVACGRSQEQNQELYDDKLHVHHVVPKRLVEADETKHAVENLVSLCSECHQQYEQLTPRALFKRAVDN